MFQPPKATGPTYNPNFNYGRYTPQVLEQAIQYAENMRVVEGFSETDEIYDAYRQDYLLKPQVVRRSISQQAQDTADKKRAALPGALRYGQEGQQVESSASARKVLTRLNQRLPQVSPAENPLDVLEQLKHQRALEEMEQKRLAAQKEQQRQQQLSEDVRRALAGFQQMSVSTPNTQSSAQRQIDDLASQQVLLDADRYAATFSSFVTDPNGNIARGAHDEYLNANAERRKVLWDYLHQLEKNQAKSVSEKAIAHQIEQDADTYANFSVALTDNFGNAAFYQSAYERYMNATPEARAALSAALTGSETIPEPQESSSHPQPLSFTSPTPVRNREVSEAVYVQRIVHALNGHVTAEDAHIMYQNAQRDSQLPQLIESLIEIEDGNAASNNARRGRP